MARVERAEVRAGLLAPARAWLRGRGRRPPLVRRERLFLLDDGQRVAGYHIVAKLQTHRGTHVSCDAHGKRRSASKIG